MTRRLEVTDLKHEYGLADGARRLGATAIDLWVVLAWAAIGAIVYLILRGLGQVPTTPLASDVLGFLTMVLPVTATLAAQEASRHQSTIGKRRLGLIVTTAAGNRVSFARSMARSGVKFLPWQLAHTGVFHLIAASTDPVFMGLAIGAQVLVLGNLAVMLLHPEHRALHDLVSGTRVVDSRPDVR